MQGSRINMQGDVAPYKMQNANLTSNVHKVKDTSTKTQAVISKSPTDKALFG
jgi:hypothetical protein